MQRCNPTPVAILVAGFLLLSLSSVLSADTRAVQPEEQSLQRAIDAATAGDILQLTTGRYSGPVVRDRAVTLLEVSGSIIDGEGRGRVLTVAAPDVVVQGITVQNSGDQLSREDTGIYVTAEADRAQSLNNRLRHNLIGIYLKGPDDAVVRGNQIIGRQDLRMNERGNGIQLWNTPGSIIEANEVGFGRDGIFVNASRNNRFVGNHLSELSLLAAQRPRS
jgi:nitrous oxidase accessory protein